MCGRYSLATPDPSRVRERFGLAETVEVRRRYNIAPGDDVLAVVRDREGPSVGTLLRWGLVPHWANSPDTGLRMINARAETVAERPAYRDALRSRRCLIPADGFYEWRALPGGKQPYWITRSDGEPFAFAGLWATWHGGEEPLRTCAIVTAEAGAALREIHARMPVILPMAAEALWLDPEAGPEDLLALLRPPADAPMAARAVSRAVNDARYDGPECIAPDRDAARSLF